MLESMRSGSKNIFVKAFLGVLALSFIVWGVGDVFRGRTNTTIATIGDLEVSYYEYNNSLMREVTRYQQILGRSLTDEQIEQFNIKNVVLNQLVDNKLIKKRVSEIGFMVGNDVAKEQILLSSAFVGEDGEFDENAFNAILRTNGINKDEYITMLKQDAATRVFLDSYATSPASMKMQANALYEFRNEQRVADVLTIPATYIKNVDNPTEADLVQYYQENNEKFAIPELREVTYLTLGVENIHSDLKISEEELRAEYENSIESYMQPEMRDVDQYLFSSEEEAKKAYENMAKGKLQKFSDKKISLGNVSKDGLPDEVKEVIFNLSEKNVSQPVKTQLGWHIFSVNKISEPVTKSFEEVKESIEDAVLELRASDVFFEFANQVEDSFASGLSIEEVAEKFNVVIHKSPSFDSKGNSNKGKEISTLPEKDVFIPLAFNTEEGFTSSLTLLSDNTTYLVLRVDNVAKERTKALDEVKGTARDMWMRDEKVKKLRELAEDASNKIRDGEAVSKVAKELNLKVQKSKIFSRPDVEQFSSQINDEPVAMVKELFSINEKDATSSYKNAKGDFVIGLLKEIKKAEMDDVKFKEIHRRLKEDFIDDALSQYNIYLRNEYPVTVNKTLLNDVSSF